ncbi:MAG: hypothetical protein ACI30I_03415 [Parabacteroides sp.]
MKKQYLITLLCLIALCLQGCKVGNVASSQGLPDQAYLYFESANEYKGDVEVTLEPATTFRAKVYLPKKHLVKGETYAVATGKRHLRVSYQGKVIYERTLMFTTQETQKILLP